MGYPLLEKINSPEDLKSLGDKEIDALCTEIRSFLVENVEKTGGHLASNLGVVELTVALHRAFNSPKDKIIFDVGHQAYVHKLITGRRDSFGKLRKTGGLSGFTLRKESEHDPFGAGHSSTSISAALGFAEANALQGSDAYTVALLGDGAFTGGMIHEAINNCKQDLKLIIILNENRMSISKNKGTFASYLARVRVSEGYMKWKKGTSSFLKHLPLIGKPLIFCLSVIKNKLKRMIYSTNYFEDLGFYYIGPVNGNEYGSVTKAINEAKRLGKCCIIHTYTKKGKGYEPAEREPHSFHSVRTKAGGGSTFHSELAKGLIELADNDEKIVAITAAMGIGTGLSAFEAKFPKRYYDVGIAEAHALTFSAGLAAAGLKPYVGIYSTFLQRGYDNILHDIALQELPVRILIDRAGLAVSDGATHHGIFDISFLMHIPNTSIYSPATYGSLKQALSISNELTSAVAIRYPDAEEAEGVSEAFYPTKDYSLVGVTADKDFCDENVFIAIGCTAKRALMAKKLLSDVGVASGVILVERLKPYSDVVDMIAEKIKNSSRVLFVEEGIKNGSFSMIVLSELKRRYPELLKVRADIAAIDDNFAAPRYECDLYDYAGLSAKKLRDKMLAL